MDALVAGVLDDAIPIERCVWQTLVGPQAIYLDHCRRRANRPQEHAVRLVADLQLRTRRQTEPLAKMLRDNQPPRLVDPQSYAIYRCHIPFTMPRSAVRAIGLPGLLTAKDHAPIGELLIDA